MDPENEDEYLSSFQKSIKELQDKSQDIILSATSVLSGLGNILEKLDNKNSSENKDINSKLSVYTHLQIQNSRGPLNPDKLTEFLIKEVFDKKQLKEVLTKIRIHSDNTDEVKVQLSQILQKVEARVNDRKTQNNLDDKFIKAINKLIKKIDEEKSKEQQSNTRQSVLNFEQSKRKINNSEQKGELTQTSNTTKRLKSNPLENTAESYDNTEFQVTIGESSESCQNTVPKVAARSEGQNQLDAKRNYVQRLSSNFPKTSSAQPGSAAGERVYKKKKSGSATNIVLTAEITTKKTYQQ